MYLIRYEKLPVSMRKTELLFYLSLCIISILTVFDLFFNQGQPATMDGVIHISGMAQFAQALGQGQFPVTWLNNFANYGLPVGLFSHQIPIYLGAIFVFLTHNAVLSASLVTGTGVIVANLLLYRFLRIYISEWSAFSAVLLFSVAPFRILDIYIRGAIPEVFSACLLPFILLSMYLLFKERKLAAFFLLVLGFAGLLLTHPMMLVIFSFLIFPYFIFLLYDLYRTVDNHKIKAKRIVARIMLFLSSLVLGLGLGSYYLFPLFLEKKYFYFGSGGNMLTDSFLGTASFFSARWYYFYQNDIFTRGHVVQFGLPETLIVILGIVVFVFYVLRRKQAKNKYFLLLVIISGLLSIFFTLKVSSILYQIIPFLSDIQFPWRMLSVAVFIPPIIIGVIMDNSRFRWLFVCLIIGIFVFRMPQLYGKNYTSYPESFYQSNMTNLYSVNMNTIWTGKTEDYPPKKTQAKIISGQGKIVVQQISGTKRIYDLQNNTPTRLVDYTFYFPGWNVYIDGKPTPIQFQDPSFRGVITYNVPEGRHTVQVIFQDTVVRRLAKLLSLGVGILFILLFIFRTYPVKLLQRYV